MVKLRGFVRSKLGLAAEDNYCVSVRDRVIDHPRPGHIGEQRGAKDIATHEQGADERQEPGEGAKALRKMLTC
jgi:hypothetical protein